MLAKLRDWLHRRDAPERYAQLTVLLRNQALSRAALLDKQQCDFAAMVAHARAQVPYYAERFAACGDRCLPQDLPQNLPILEKDAVRAHLDELLDRCADRALVKLGHTGGSTGKPLAFWYDAAKHELMRAGMMRGFMMSGWRPGQKILNFWGASRDTRRGGVFGGGGWREHMAAEKSITAVEYSEARLHAWARFIQHWRPTLLYGYVSALTELARYIIAARLPMPNSLIGVYCTAEMLDAWQRELITQAFGCKVFNQYGCREVPNIAWECRHGHMHVFADLVWLESLHIPGEAGGENHLLVSSLTNRLMPFIRYNLGDSGRLLEGECACGLPFPLMEMGLCRQNDLIRTASGKLVHPSCFNRLLYGKTHIRQYQWVQRSPDCMALHVVTAHPLAEAETTALNEALRREVDAAMSLVVYRVEAIPRTITGKHRFVIGLDR